MCNKSCSRQVVYIHIVLVTNYRHYVYFPIIKMKYNSSFILHTHVKKMGGESPGYDEEGKEVIWPTQDWGGD